MLAGTCAPTKYKNLAHEQPLRASDTPRRTREPGEVTPSRCAALYYVFVSPRTRIGPRPPPYVQRRPLANARVGGGKGSVLLCLPMPPQCNVNEASDTAAVPPPPHAPAMCWKNKFTGT